MAKGYIRQYGIDFDEVFASVARNKTIRLLISLTASNGWKIHHLDVKTGFLHGELKETFYITQQEGFIVKGCGKKVYKIIKVLYGLSQAPRAWNNKLKKNSQGTSLQEMFKRTVGLSKNGGQEPSAHRSICR